MSFPSPGPLAPKTTEQEDITTAGQRKINLVWEYTQAIIAVTVVVANVIVAVAQGLYWSENLVHPPTLSNTLFLVVGFYFSRTNHERIGGIGPKPPLERYEGR